MAIITPTATGYDLVLDPTPAVDDGQSHANIGLIFERGQARDTPMNKPAVMRIDPDPGIETTDNPVYANVSGGMGATEQFAPGRYGYALGAYCRGGSYVLPGGKVTEINVTGFVTDTRPIRSHVNFNGNLYFFGGRQVIRFTGGVGLPQLAKDFGAGVACGKNAAVVFNGSGTPLLCVGTIVVATDLAWHMWSTPDDVTWTDNATISRRAFETVSWNTDGLFGERLIGMPSRTTFQTCSGNPTVAGNWSGAAQVGSGLYSTLSIAKTAHHIWFATLEGIISVNAQGYSSNHTPYWLQSYSLVNGAASLAYDGYVYGSWGHGLDRIPWGPDAQHVPQACQPGADEPGSSPIFGYVTALTVERGWICAAVYNPTLGDSYICYGKDRERLGINGPGPLLWHGAEAVIPGEVTHMHVASPLNQQPRLWVWSDDGGVIRCHTVSLPETGDPLQDLMWGGGHQFQPEFSVFYPDGWMAPTSRRALYRSDIHGDRLGGAQQISAYANRNRETDASGNLVWDLELTAGTSPRVSQVSPNTTGESSFRTDFKLVGQGEPDAPPVLRAYAPYADVSREQSKVLSMRFWVERNQQLRNGDPDPQDHDVLIESVWSLISEDGRPVTASGPKGQELVLQFLPNSFSIEERENGDGGFGQLITCHARVLYGIFYWDSGVEFDGRPFYT